MKTAVTFVVGVLVTWVAITFTDMHARSVVAHSGGLIWSGVEYRCVVKDETRHERN